MNSACKSAVECVDVRLPVRATYVNLYKWPESDAEFVKSVTEGREGKRTSITNVDCSSRRRWAQSPTVADSYSCRQMYLRSYTFSKKESVPEKTRRCLVKVKERASLFYFTHIRNSSDTNKRRKKKKKEEGCVVVRKLRNVSSSTVYYIFRRLLSCTTTIDVMDRHPK